MSALARNLRELAERCQNGAVDPWQEFYDLGAAPLLERIADAIEAEWREEVRSTAAGVAERDAALLNRLREV